MSTNSLATLQNLATRLRIDSVQSTSKAGSGHPTTCLSAAEIMSVVFFDEMRFDPKDPRNPDNDRFVLSKGHAAPILYAAWAEAGLFPREELLQLRKFESDLEGHPTPRLSFVDVATGSLGQGICAAVGIALNARRIGSAYRTYVLLGDGEIAEGSVWEAADSSAYHKLDNLCAIVDVNGLGQSQATEFGHDLNRIAARWHAFGWNAVVVDGHSIPDLQQGLQIARSTTGRPTVLVAKTLKGKALSTIEGKDAWHGKALKSGEEADKAVKELEAQLVGCRDDAGHPGPSQRQRQGGGSGLRQASRAGLQEGRSGGDARSLGHGARGGRRPRSPHRGARCRRQEFHVQRSVREEVPGAVLRDVHRGAGHGRRRHGLRGPRRHSVPVDVRLLPLPRRRLHPHGRHLHEQRQADRVARRRLDRRGRPVADGARGSRDDARDSRRGRALSLRRGQHGAARCGDGAAPRPVLHAHLTAEDTGHVRPRGQVPDRRRQGPAAERGRRGDGGGSRRHGVRGAEGLRPAQGRGHLDPGGGCVFGPADRCRHADRRGRMRRAAS